MSKRKGQQAKYPFKSKFEQEVYEKYFKPKGYEYEPNWSRVMYVQPAKDREYIPDYIHPNRPDIVYEAKGFPRDRESLYKYLWVRQSNPDLNIRFILQNPNCRAYPRVKIKLWQWLEANEFEWCAASNIPKTWLRKPALLGKTKRDTHD